MSGNAKRCKGTTKSGKPCQSTWIGPDGYCRHHSPAERNGESAPAEGETGAIEKTPKAFTEAVADIVKHGKWLEMFSLGFLHTRAIDKLIDAEHKHGFDEMSGAIVRGEVEGLMARMADEYNVTNVLEQMVLQRVVISHARLALMESRYSIYVDPFAPADTDEHWRRGLSAASTEFLRNVRALKDLKTVPLKVTIREAGQVNLGQQQVNVNEPKKMEHDDGLRVEVTDAQRSERGLTHSTQTEEDCE